MPPGSKTHTMSSPPAFRGAKAYAQTWDVDQAAVDHVPFQDVLTKILA